MRALAVLILVAVAMFAQSWPFPGPGRAAVGGGGGGGGFTEVGGGSQRVASGANDSVDSDTTDYPGNVTSGTMLVVAGAAWGATAPTGVTVSGCGASWTTVLGAVGGGLTWRTFISYGTGHAAGACTVTVNPAAASNSFSYSMDEFSGQAASPSSVAGGDTADTGTAPADSITTATAGELIIGVVSQDGATIAITPGASYTQIGETENNTTNQSHNAVFRIATTAAAYSVDWTLASSTSWSAQTHSFKVP
jgi:hypothetical protein